MEETSRGLSRRGFLGAAGVLAAGTALITSAGLTGCAPSAKSSSSAAASGSGSGSQGAAQLKALLNPQDETYSTYTTDFKALFEPLKVGSLNLRNRIVKSPAGSDTWIPEGDNLNENYLTYYEGFAKGGASVVFLESAISKFMSIRIANGERSISGWLLEDFDKIPTLMKPVVDRVHKHDAYIGFQVAAGTADVATCTLDDLAWLQDNMVRLSVKLKEAGFDIIELHSSATQFMKNMLVPRFNTRDDEYGCQSLENRTRFTCETIKKIKEACGNDFTIQVLMDACEENDQELGLNDGFITLREAIDNAKQFEAAGADTIYLRQSVPGRHIAQFAADLMHTGYACNGLNGYGGQFNFARHFGGSLDGSHSGCGALLKATEAFKKELTIPVTAAGYMDPRTAPDLMNNAIADGKIDYLMITRPLTVDPEMPNKLKEGKRDEIAPCCRCMHCHNKGGDSYYDYTVNFDPSGKGMLEFCRVNAATQRAYTAEMPEGYEPTMADKAKKVMVVGAGPAGMEAARIAAQRGHEVTLYEKKGSLGGLMLEAHMFKGDHERLGDLVDYLAHQQEVKGVKVVTGTEVTAETVASEKPDAVIIAVGGKRDTKLSSVDAIKVVSVDDAASTDLGENVIILGANAQATDLALFLLAQGKNVQMVHEGGRADIDKEQSTWVRTFVTPYLYAQGVKIWNKTKVKELTKDGLIVVDTLNCEETLPCSAVVECYDMLPNTDLYDAISSNVSEVYKVGDCDKPFDIAQAIAAGNLAARKL